MGTHRLLAHGALLHRLLRPCLSFSFCARARGPLRQRALLFCFGGFRVRPLRKYAGHTWTIIGHSPYSGRWLARIQSPKSQYWETGKVL